MEFKLSELEKIKADYEMASCDLHMIELFDLWIQRNTDCNWSTVLKILRRMGENDLAGNISHYVQEIGRIESFTLPEEPDQRPNLKYCRPLAPLKDYCYEDTELQKRYFDANKLDCEAIVNSGLELDIQKCLRPRCNNWYEIGTLMGLPKYILDDIRNKRPQIQSSLALSKMINALYEKLAFKATWRKLIDTLLDMNFITIAGTVEDLALTGCKCHEVATIWPRKYKRSDFTTNKSKMFSGKYTLEYGLNEEKAQRCLKKIRNILNLQTPRLSDENVLDGLYKHIVTRNPSQVQMKTITECVEQISKLSIVKSDELTQQARELRRDYETTKRVILRLKKDKRELEISKSIFENGCREINEEIESVTESKSNKKSNEAG